MDGGYHKLEIYTLAYSLCVEIHKMTFQFPKFEMHEEGGQIGRSSKPVSSNIVEGFALRKYKNEFLHYLYRAYSSSEEPLEHLQFVFETKSLFDENLFNYLRNKVLRLNGKIFRFIQGVEKEHDTPVFLKEPEPEYRSEFPNEFFEPES
ncbi:MAG: four helix bundle protein [Bacteroidota bacterium]|nr:four helix bundle protein [Bacteroidota bacterium]